MQSGGVDHGLTTVFEQPLEIVAEAAGAARPRSHPNSNPRNARSTRTTSSVNPPTVEERACVARSQRGMANARCTHMTSRLLMIVLLVGCAEPTMPRSTKPLATEVVQTQHARRSRSRAFQAAERGCRALVATIGELDCLHVPSSRFLHAQRVSALSERLTARSTSSDSLQGHVCDRSEARRCGSPSSSERAAIPRRFDNGVPDQREDVEVAADQPRSPLGVRLGALVEATVVARSTLSSRWIAKSSNQVSFVPPRP